LGTLYVVATPIGNLEDLSPRARRVLGEVELIAAEDTRHTGSMLRRLGISTPLLSNHGFNERARVTRFLDALSAGDIALVSDSGTPAISDPGAILVRAAADAGHSVVPVPGPSAVAAAVSASGLVEGPFIFLGFLPRAAGDRKSTLMAGLGTGMPLVLYESGPRINSLAATMAEVAPARSVVVFRELTKLHEEAVRATAAELPSRLSTTTRKGEFAIVVGPGIEERDIDPDAQIAERLDRGERPSEIARDVAKATGLPRSELYDKVMHVQRERGEG
jgi:16S rRNA (cytidine1402-2'-O)-methyltransferase